MQLYNQVSFTAVFDKLVFLFHEVSLTIHHFIYLTNLTEWANSKIQSCWIFPAVDILRNYPPLYYLISLNRHPSGCLFNLIFSFALCSDLAADGIFGSFLFFFFLLQLGFQFDFIRSAVLRSLHLSCQPQTKPPEGYKYPWFRISGFSHTREFSMAGALATDWCSYTCAHFSFFFFFFTNLPIRYKLKGTDLLSLFCMVGTFG